MISIILERRMGRFNMKPKYGRATRFTTVRSNKDIPTYDPSGKSHVFQSNRRALGIYNRSIPSSLIGSNKPDKLPKDLLTGMLLKIFPKIFKHKGSMLDLDEMNRQGTDILSPQSMNFIERKDMVCILFTEKASAWYSFKDKKVYDLYNNGRFNMFRKTPYSTWVKDVLQNRHKMFKIK